MADNERDTHHDLYELQILNDKLMAAVTPLQPMSEAEAKASYDDVTLRQIFVALKPSGKPARTEAAAKQRRGRTADETAARSEFRGRGAGRLGRSGDGRVGRFDGRPDLDWLTSAGPEAGADQHEGWGAREGADPEPLRLRHYQAREAHVKTAGRLREEQATGDDQPGPAAAAGRVVGLHAGVVGQGEDRDKGRRAQGLPDAASGSEGRRGDESSGKGCGVRRRS